MSDERLDAIVIGAGPAGLSCAIGLERGGYRYVVLDKGGVVETIYRMPTDMVFFTTPELLEIGGMPMVCSGPKPTRAEGIRSSIPSSNPLPALRIETSASFRPESTGASMSQSGVSMVRVVIGRDRVTS